MKGINLYKWASFCFMLLDLNAYSQWGPHCIFDINYSIPTWSTTGVFEDADFITKDTGVYSYWYQCSPSVSSPCYAVTMKSTLDGGNSWASSLSVGGTQTTLYPYVVRKQKTMYAVRNTITNPSTTSTTIYKSSNGGGSWNVFYSNTGARTSLPSGPDTSHLFFWRTSTFAFTPKFLCKRVNGVFYDSIYDISAMSIQDVVFPDSLIGYMAAAASGKISLIHKTKDGGSSWDTIYYNPARSIRKLFFLDSLNGYGVCDSARVIKTSDGGKIWNEINTSQHVNLNSVFFMDTAFGLACGDSGLIIRTVDGGMTWTKDSTSTSVSFRKIFVVNDTFGMAICNAALYRTNLFLNGIWEPVSNIENIIPFPNPTTGELSIELPSQLQSSNSTFYSIYDSYGNLIERKYFDDTILKIDLSSKSKGLYLILVSDGSEFFKCKTLLTN